MIITIIGATNAKIVPFSVDNQQLRINRMYVAMTVKYNRTCMYMFSALGFMLKYKVI